MYFDKGALHLHDILSRGSRRLRVFSFSVYFKSLLSQLRLLILSPKLF